MLLCVKIRENESTYIWSHILEVKEEVDNDFLFILVIVVTQTLNLFGEETVLLIRSCFYR